VASCAGTDCPAVELGYTYETAAPFRQARGAWRTGWQVGKASSCLVRPALHSQRPSGVRFRMPGVRTSRLVRRTGPPPMRQLTSMRRGPWVVYFSSTWNTPCRGGERRSLVHRRAAAGRLANDEVARACMLASRQSGLRQGRHLELPPAGTTSVQQQGLQPVSVCKSFGPRWST